LGTLIMKSIHFLSLALLCSIGFVLAQDKGTKNILLIAGTKSHGYGAHEHNAGVLLFKKCLDESGLPVKTTAKLNAQWPSKQELAAADTVLIYCDGGKNHLLLKEDRLQQLAHEMKRGCGLVCVHYGVEYPKEAAGAEMLEWMGGYFEMHWSVNPHWDANFTKYPDHPISQGLKPYEIRDEWYFHMRFADKSGGDLTHILSAIAPDETMKRGDGPHSGNPDVRKAVAAKIPQSVGWAFQRKDGGRGFGFTGGHFHENWGNENQRRVMLNAILWTAKAEVPEGGVKSTVSEEELWANMDYPKPKNWDERQRAKKEASKKAGAHFQSKEHACASCAFVASVVERREKK